MKTQFFRAIPVLAILGLSALVPARGEAQDTLAVTDAYIRAMPGAPSGAAFMVIENHTSADDRLVGARSEIAERVELHTHKADAQGMMQMLHVPEGFSIPAGGSHQLARGADHVMFMGLRQTLQSGDRVEVVLEFEQAGDMPVMIEVDMARQDAPAGAMRHDH